MTTVPARMEMPPASSIGRAPVEAGNVLLCVREWMEGTTEVQWRWRCRVRTFRPQASGHRLIETDEWPRHECPLDMVPVCLSSVTD